jgi:prevent-host-death family protein
MINIHEAKTNLSKIIEKVERTKQPAIIARHGKPVVRIIPLEVISKKSLAGALIQINLICLIRKLRSCFSNVFA